MTNYNESKGKRKFLSVFLAITCLCVFGCATLLDGSKQEIRIHCDPSEEINVIADGKTIDYINGYIYLDKKRETHFVTFKKEGYHHSTVAFNTHVNPFWVSADLIWLVAAPIAWFVDWQTGAIYRVDPRDIHVVLRKKKEVMNELHNPK